MLCSTISNKTIYFLTIGHRNQMIDLKRLREHPQETIDLIAKKDPSFNAQLLYELDQQIRTMTHEVEELRHQKNELARSAKQGLTPEIREQSIQTGKQIDEKQTRINALEKEFSELYLSCPNLPDAHLPVGGKEANKVVSTWSEQPHFSFTPKNHVEIATALGWIDFEAAARMTGTNFALYKGEGVALLYRLVMFMLGHNSKYGYTPVLPPYLVTEKSLEVASNFPKFKDQVYSVTADQLYLTPTAEVNLTNLYRDHIFSADQLPVRMTSWTSCFRREAGGYGGQERGLIRIHQFEKVELYTICEPAHAAQEHERMLACAESILQQLGLHYRVSILAAQDCSFPSAKTYDIEVWLAGQKQYYEVSSVSNCTDFQARRGLIRYKKQQDSKTELVYTLNGSSLALSRLMVAILENYQQPDGTVVLPEVLRNPVPTI